MAYTATTSNTVNKVTATQADSSDTLSITLNGTAISNGSNAAWEAGENNLIITVRDAQTGTSKVYTVTVTKE